LIHCGQDAPLYTKIAAAKIGKHVIHTAQEDRQRKKAQVRRQVGRSYTIVTWMVRPRPFGGGTGLPGGLSAVVQLPIGTTALNDHPRLKIRAVPAHGATVAPGDEHD
jgi:hypothetical protein